MEITRLFFGAEVLFWGVCLILLVYLFIRRRKIKRWEDFADRDN